jgi:hypothetical protein
VLSPSIFAWRGWRFGLIGCADVNSRVAPVCGDVVTFVSERAERVGSVSEKPSIILWPGGGLHLPIFPAVTASVCGTFVVRYVW